MLLHPLTSTTTKHTLRVCLPFTKRDPVGVARISDVSLINLTFYSSFAKLKLIMEYISTTQLRENFRQLKDGLAAGESYTLIHRSQPIAQIKPYGGEVYGEQFKEATLKEKTKKKAALVKKLSGGFDLGKGLTPDEMSRRYEREVYGQVLS